MIFISHKLNEKLLLASAIFFNEKYLIFSKPKTQERTFGIKIIKKYLNSMKYTCLQKLTYGMLRSY